MDAVISIGGQSFLDGLVRLLGPALQPVRTPIPVALPGLTNGLLTIRSIVPQLPGATPGVIELAVEFTLSAEVLLVANVAAGNLNLALPAGNINLGASTGTVAEQARTGTLSTNQGTGTGTVGAAALNLTLNALTGAVQLPAATAPLNLGPIVGTLQFPPAPGGVALPLPAVVPVPVNFTPTAPLSARIFLSPNVNGAIPGGPSFQINAATGFGLDFNFFGVPTVQLPPLTGNTFATALQAAIPTAFDTVAGQLLQGLTPIVQPATNLPGVANAVAAAMLVALRSTLEDAFAGLKARTGRLIYPPPATGSSCDIRALPTVGRTRMVIAADGSIVLQIGFDRVDIPPTDQFPAFTPTAALDTRVTLENSFVRDLLVCLVEKFPNLSLPPLPPTITNTPALRGATWAPVMLTVGPLALGGSLALTISGTPAPPGMPPRSKAIALTFTLAQSIGAPFVIGSALDIGLTFTLPIAFDLSKLASISALRLSGAFTPTVVFGLGTGLTVMLVVAGAAFLITAFVGPVPIFMPGLAVIGTLIMVLPHIVTAIIRSLLTNAVNLVLSVVHLLEAPAALPPGIFDAFGTLVPTSMIVDDLVADGVLDTPTSPWAVLPIASRVRATPPPSSGGGSGTIPPPGGGTTRPPVTPWGASTATTEPGTS